MTADEAAGERRWWRPVGGLVMAVVIVLAGSQAWAALVQQHFSGAKVYEQQARMLVLDTGTAQVTVQPGPPGRVTVRRDLDWTLRKPVVSMLWEGDVLSVSVRCGSLPVHLGDVGCDARIGIEVAPGTEVSGRSTSGSTEVRGLTGDVRLRTTSGAILLSGLGGQISARSTSGLIRGLALAGPQVQASTDSGELRLTFARPPDAVTASVGSGEMGIVVPPGSRYRISGHSVSGNRSIDPALADPASPRSIDVAAGSGTVGIALADG
ncbi:hypothetical protein [Kitasatospora sp. NBC_00315]|uniref:hypothetical protein n=1 Tax=Kitasatospora sp. NBC_00315 TaxID=2975963 RepID=UPI00324538D7